MTNQRFDVRFTGRVQGVSFRWTTCRLAERFGVAGWVCNEPDGSVRLVAEGHGDELDRFVSAVQDAMAGYIKDTAIAKGGAEGVCKGFTVRH